MFGFDRHDMYALTDLLRRLDLFSRDRYAFL
jgi:hypothetical protein